MPSDTPPKLPLPTRVRLYGYEAEDADAACAQICADPATDSEARKAALAARREASENYHIWRDVLKEMD